MDYTFRPIQQWPGAFTTERRRSQFKAIYTQTLKGLEKESLAINARNIAIQLALRDADLRRDGLPRAGSRPAHPGVILSFEKWTPNGQVTAASARLGVFRAFSMPCDTYLSWEENLRAITLSLKALRDIDRFGVTQSGEQYTGWAQLPAGNIPDAREEAARLVSDTSGIVITAFNTDADALEQARRIGLRRLHPDQGGDGDAFGRFQAAVALLKSTL
jgi:hypothetical protein